MEPSKEFKDTINEAIRKENARNAAIEKTNTAKANITKPVGMPVLPKNSDIETLTSYWHAFGNWLKANGARSPLLQQLGDREIEKAPVTPDKNPGVPEKVGQPKHDGTSRSFGNSTQEALKVNAAVTNFGKQDRPNKARNFNKRSGKWELV